MIILIYNIVSILLGIFVVAPLYNKVFLSEENTTATDADIAVMELNFSLNYLEKSSEILLNLQVKKKITVKKVVVNLKLL